MNNLLKKEDVRVLVLCTLSHSFVVTKLHTYQSVLNKTFVCSFRIHSSHLWYAILIYLQRSDWSMLLWTCFFTNPLLGECDGGPWLGWNSLISSLSFVLPFHLLILFFSCPSQLSLHYDAECYAHVIMYLFLSFLPKMVLWLPATSILLLDKAFSPYGRMLNCCVCEIRCTWYEIEYHNYRSEIASWCFCPFLGDNALMEVLRECFPTNMFFRRAKCMFALHNCVCRHFVCAFMCADSV